MMMYLTEMIGIVDRKRNGLRGSWQGICRGILHLVNSSLTLLVYKGPAGLLSLWAPPTNSYIRGHLYKGSNRFTEAGEKGAMMEEADNSWIGGLNSPARPHQRDAPGNRVR